MCIRTSIAVLHKELYETLNMLIYGNKRHFIIHLFKASCKVSCCCFFGVLARRVSAGMALCASQQGLAEHGGGPSNFRAGHQESCDQCASRGECW